MGQTLPRLLEEGRVEVRLCVKGTHVFEEYEVDRLLKHLLDAKELLKPVEPSSPEGKSRLYLRRKLDVARIAKIVLPYLMKEADKADERDEETVTVTVNSIYSALNVISFIDNLEMYEKDLREEMQMLKAENATLQSLVPHPGDGTCARCGTGGAQSLTIALCEECRGLESDIAYHAARSDIECICIGHYENGHGSAYWYDLQSTDNDDDAGFIAQAETYLAARKLLERHPENPNWVRPLDVEAVQP